jgi:glucose-1-phosphate cytidylyltransferase
VTKIITFINTDIFLTLSSLGGYTMKVVILAGGVGSRLSEETEIKPKPMVEIGGKPILWHILKHYSHYGHNEFVIALGYKGNVLKKYFMDYATLNGDMSINIKTGEVKRQNGKDEDWNIHLVDTGLESLTATRIKKLQQYIGNERFMMTWGDGVSDVDLEKLLTYHKSHGKLVTLTAVHPPARFGHLEIESGQIKEFSEKPQTREGRINGAFFVLEPGVFDYIPCDGNIQWEKGPMQQLAKDGQLMAYEHNSFWQCMDTLRDKKLLEELWASGNPPWKIWK